MALYSLAVLTPLIGEIVKSELWYVSILLVCGLLTILLVWKPLVDSFKKMKVIDYLIYLPSLAFIQISVIILIVIILNTTGSTSTSLMSSNNNVLDTINSQFSNQTLILILNQFWIGIVGPIVENILFIYLIQGQLLDKLGRYNNLTKAIQVILTSLLFMCWHLSSLHNFTDPGFYRYLALAWMPIVYLKTNSLAKTIVAHIGLNLVVIILYFV